MSLHASSSFSGGAIASGLTGTGATVTTSQPLLDLSQTWNAGGVTFTGWKLNVTDTSSASGSLLVDLQKGGTSQFSVGKTGIVATPGYFWSNSNSVNAGLFFGTSSDVQLSRDAANTLALRNGTSAQTYRVYNTFTDASNGEWAELVWSSNVAYLRAQKNGTGTQRNLVPVTGATTVASLPAASTAGAGARLMVTDSNTTTFMATVAGGGANIVPVVSDGTNWKVG